MSLFNRVNGVVRVPPYNIKCFVITVSPEPFSPGKTKGIKCIEVVQFALFQSLLYFRGYSIYSDIVALSISIDLTPGHGLELF